MGLSDDLQDQRPQTLQTGKTNCSNEQLNFFMMLEVHMYRVSTPALLEVRLGGTAPSKTIVFPQMRKNAVCRSPMRIVTTEIRSQDPNGAVKKMEKCQPSTAYKCEMPVVNRNRLSSKIA